MAVVGLDIGDHSSYITVAKQGGVDTIANDYTLRNTPSIVALGGKQRFMGVSAENQRNLTVGNTISYFKNFLGRSFKDEYVQTEAKSIGADVIELEDGKVGFKVQDQTYRPEQILAMLFTKVKDIVRSDQGEEISTCVVSIPLHFTETQRSAVLDAGVMAGLPIVQLMHDTSALALAYAKTRNEDLSNTDQSQPRYVVFVDCGAGGLQSTMVAVSKDRAMVLGSSSTTSTGGKFFDNALVEHLTQIIETKYKCQMKDNKKAMNKLRTSVEKIKKQMSANSNKLPIQIDSLVGDVDVSVTIDRATFEELIKESLNDVKKTLQELLISTTIKKDAIHSVEIAGGSSRVPAIKQIVQDVFGLSPSFSLNSDEGTAKGCGLQAAAQSDKFLTKKFDIQEVVKNGIEAVFVHEGKQEKVLIHDEGDSDSMEKVINIKADLPVSIALQYSENVDIDNRFIALYQVVSEAAKNADLEVIFQVDQNGMIQMKNVNVMTKEAPKRRKTFESSLDLDDAMDTSSVPNCQLKFEVTSMGGLPSEILLQCKKHEGVMVKGDIEEVARQEAKNVLEEQLYKYRADVIEDSDNIEEEDTFKQIKEYFDQTENWLYEDGEDAPKQIYENILKSFHEKMKVFKLWKIKLNQMKAKEEERKQFLEQNKQQTDQGRMSRQIPVVYEGQEPYTSRSAGSHGEHQQDHQDAQRFHGKPHPEQGWVRPPSDHGYSRPSHADPFFPGPPRHANLSSPRFERSRRSQMSDDPFFGRSPFFNNDPLFGW